MTTPAIEPLSAEELAYREQAAKTELPELFEKLYPRRYRNIGRFHSPKHLAAVLTTSALIAIRNETEATSSVFRLLIPGMRYMMDRRMPLLFIAPNLLDAVKKTEFDQDIGWPDMPLPYEHGIFVLPVGGLSHPEYDDAAYIYWSRLRPGTYPSPSRELPPMEFGGTAISILCYCPKFAMWFDRTLNAPERPMLKLGNFFSLRPGEETPPVGRDGADGSLPLETTDDEFMDRVCMVAFGTLLALAARPSLNTPARIVPGKHKHGVRDWWEPNIVGANYAMRSEHQGGSHASPRMHWRRGHFRNQRYGPNNVNVRTIWIEPLLVAAETETVVPQ